MLIYCSIRKRAVAKVAEVVEAVEEVALDAGSPPFRRTLRTAKLLLTTAQC